MIAAPGVIGAETGEIMARENEPGSLQYDYCKYVPHSDAEKKPSDIGYKCVYC